VEPVAINTGNIITLVSAAFPADVVSTFMAIGTHTVLLFYGYLRAAAESQYRWAIPTGSNLTGMSALFYYLLNGFRARDAGSVAGFALQAGKW
jgi:hypothetical protein